MTSALEHRATQSATPAAAVGPGRPTAAPARWIAAILLIFYGFSKVNGAQFRMIDSELAKPLGEVSGFWLTWHYFGYSPVYRLLLAAVEVAGGVLLVIPRTSLLAALVLLPVSANILVVDVLYGVGEALPAAIAVLICLVVAVSGHLRDLSRAVLRDGTEHRVRTATRAAILAGIIGVAFVFHGWVTNAVIRAPTPIDGVWSVVDDARPVAAEQRYSRVFFELNRAGMAVFRLRSGVDEVHHFEVEGAHTVRVWDAWRRKGELLMEGRLDPSGDIELTVESRHGGGRIVLRRVSGPVAR